MTINPTSGKFLVLELWSKKERGKEVSDEVDFLHADKHESFLKIDTLIFDDDAMSSQYLKKEIS